MDLFLHSSVSIDDPEVAVMLEQCRVRLRDQINKVAEVKLLCIVHCTCIVYIFISIGAWLHVLVQFI